MRLYVGILDLEIETLLKVFINILYIAQDLNFVRSIVMVTLCPNGWNHLLCLQKVINYIGKVNTRNILEFRILKIGISSKKLYFSLPLNCVRDESGILLTHYTSGEANTQPLSQKI